MSGRMKWLLFIVVFGGIAVALAWYLIAEHRKPSQQSAKEQATTEPSRISKDKSGQTIVTVTAEEQARSAITTQALATGSFQPQWVAYGALQDDPSNSFTVRAPFAGILRAADHPFPKLGDTLSAGLVQIGLIEPRFTPVEHLDLASKLAGARADVRTAEAALAAARAEYDADAKLNAQDKNVSDRTVQAARAKLDEQSAKLESARQTVTFLEAASVATTRPATSVPLTVEGDSQVVDVTAHAGETVDSGQVILRVASFNSLIAAIALPADQKVDPAAVSARVVALGDDHPLTVRGITLAPAVDQRTLGQTLLVQVQTAGTYLRAGDPVTAWLTPSQKPAQGIVVPRDAVVWHEGKAWVYVQSAANQFVRREVPTDRPMKDGWFTAAGLSANERIVVRGAQQLLSEEFKPALPAGGDVDLD